jgi:hypothetical protein
MTTEEIIALIEANLKPEGRGKATASTFRDFIECTGCTPQQLALGMYWLSTGYGTEKESPAVTGRRKTCQEIYDLIQAEFDPTVAANVDLGQNTYDVWGKWVKCLDAQRLQLAKDAPNDRLEAMYTTAVRERDELFELTFAPEQ